MTVTVDLPDAAIKAVHAITSDDAMVNLRLAAAMKLYELGRISSGAAADLAGIGRVEFLDRLAEFGVNAFQESPEDLSHELATLQSKTCFSCTVGA
jgi:predicted HTH domain antitoxin